MRRFIPKFLKKIVRTTLIDPYRRMQFRRRLDRLVSVMRESGNLTFIIATPEHGNLGDHAIVVSEIKLLEMSGYKNRVVEITNSEYYDFKDVLQLYIMPEDLVVIDGGGNLGTLWPWEDDKISDIIDTFRDNAILVFPQTCFYTNDALAAKRLERNRCVYSKAKDLTIALRDQRSYDFCKTNFPENVNLLFVPDIVLSLAGQLNDRCKQSRSGVLFCLREDHERSLSVADIEYLRSIVSLHTDVQTQTTTVLDRPVSKDQRSECFDAKLNEFASAKLVVTDRLHGMIFAYITNTPCIAFDNLSKKVSGVYFAASKLSNVYVCKGLNDFAKVFDIYYYSDAQLNEFNSTRYKGLISKIKSTIIL